MQYLEWRTYNITVCAEWVDGLYVTDRIRKNAAFRRLTSLANKLTGKFGSLEGGELYSAWLWRAAKGPCKFSGVASTDDDTSGDVILRSRFISASCSESFLFRCIFNFYIALGQTFKMAKYDYVSTKYVLYLQNVHFLFNFCYFSSDASR